MKTNAVYIMASDKNGTLYIGVTNDLARRVKEHKESAVDGFTKKYQVHLLVHCEFFVDIREAILREKQLKFWKRLWKIRLIEEQNPDWLDLSDGL
jgi:putative endonuclease